MRPNFTLVLFGLWYIRPPNYFCFIVCRYIKPTDI